MEGGGNCTSFKDGVKLCFVLFEHTGIIINILTSSHGLLFAPRNLTTVFVARKYKSEKIHFCIFARKYKNG